MKKIMFALFVIAAAAFAAVAEDRCFSNVGLKESWTISYTVTGAKLSGTFVTEPNDDPDSKSTVDFTGTKSGSQLTIKFAGKTPYETAPGAKSIVWTVVAAKLRIPMYGRNYQTGRYSSYSAVFEPCEQ